MTSSSQLEILATLSSFCRQLEATSLIAWRGSPGEGRKSGVQEACLSKGTQRDPVMRSKICNMLRWHILLLNPCYDHCTNLQKGPSVFNPDSDLHSFAGLYLPMYCYTTCCLPGHSASRQHEQYLTLSQRNQLREPETLAVSLQTHRVPRHVLLHRRQTMLTQRLATDAANGDNHGGGS